jgi:hypothetical protein
LVPAFLILQEGRESDSLASQVAAILGGGSPQYRDHQGPASQCSTIPVNFELRRNGARGLHDSDEHGKNARTTIDRHTIPRKSPHAPSFCSDAERHGQRRRRAFTGGGTGGFASQQIAPSMKHWTRWPGFGLPQSRKFDEHGRFVLGQAKGLGGAGSHTARPASPLTKSRRRRRNC